MSATPAQRRSHLNMLPDAYACVSEPNFKAEYLVDLQAVRVAVTHKKKIDVGNPFL